MAGEREERDATPKEMPKNTPDSPQAVFETFDSDEVDKDDQDLFSRVKLAAGLSPRPRPISAIEREKELIETFAEAAKRSTWNRDWEPEGEVWNPRHQLLDNHDELNDHLWRLEPDGVPPAQRKVERLASMVHSPSGPGLRGSPETASDLEDSSRENITKRRSMRVSRDKPWMTQPARFWQLHANAPEAADSMVSTMTQTDFPRIRLPREAREQKWDGQHHVIWCNFQNKQGKILNPAPVRSYFDRPREERKFRSNVKDGSVRILPLWRLEPLPGVSIVEEPEGGWPSIPRLQSGSGSPCRPREETLGPRHEATAEFNHKSTWSCPSLLTTAPSEEMLERHQGWDGRHQLISEKEVCSSGRGRDISTKESLKAMMASGDARFHSDGKWMHRHQLTFDNDGGRLPVQRNLRSYFDRSRDFPSEAGSIQMEEVLPEDDPQRAGNFTLLTSASLRKRRCKLQDSAKLRVDVWSLSEKPRKQKARIEETFRSCVSDPWMSKAQKEKRRSNWMSSHHVVF